MGEKDVATRDTCPYASDKRDCDGDWDTYCIKKWTLSVSEKRQRL